MDVVIYPRAAPGNQARIWIGVFGTARTPNLRWWIDDQPVVPVPLRDIQSVRPDKYLSSDGGPSPILRVFSGVYQFPGLEPGRTYTFKVRADQTDSQPLKLRTLPAELPKGPEDWFNVLLVSCFYQPQDSGALGNTLRRLQPSLRPHLTLMAGDQVYLDLPTQKDFPTAATKLAGIFEGTYTRNWLGSPGFADLLSMAPTASMPDDHEYWNNYPHVSAIIQNSWKENNAKQWEDAARLMWEGFQMDHSSTLGAPTELDIHPLSIFMADTRTHKHKQLDHTMLPEHRQLLDNWVTRTLENGRTGVFVSGQSLFQDPAGKFAGKVADYSLANYRDYPEIARILRRFNEAGQPVLCLTGDVHWGRITTARDYPNDRIGFYEVISSPTSLVSTIGGDQVKNAWNALKGIVNKGADWPRHSDAESPPSLFAKGSSPYALGCASEFGLRGNNACLLSFNRGGAGVQLKVRYMHITSDARLGQIGKARDISLSKK